MKMFRCCLALFSLVLLGACEMQAADGQRRPTMDLQVPAGGGGGY